MNIKLSARQRASLNRQALTLNTTPEKLVLTLVTDFLTPRSKPRLVDIAKAVGVTVMAVSLALNGHKDRTSPETLKKILAQARKLGYQPNLQARTMKRLNNLDQNHVIRSAAKRG
jgi:hypothetical protein